MQILGKRSRLMLIAVSVIMLTALGLSFALWDTSAVMAAGGSTSAYAKAKVGDTVTFGQYYQTANSAEKTPIEWLVVDKDERSGQLTLMSKYILAYGSYFGNYYYHATKGWTSSYIDKDGAEKDLSELTGGVNYNQAWSESTARAFLNNLERFDLGGDVFNYTEGLSAARTNSRILSLTNKDGGSLRTGELLASVGFSNARYWTGLNNSTGTADGAKGQALIDARPNEFMSRSDRESNNYEIYYKRPRLTDPDERIARNGFLDEAFTLEQRSMIAPKAIPGQISHRWPDNGHFLDKARYVEGAIDKIWLPSVEELNIGAGADWAGREDSWTNPSELASGMPFEYFKNYANYGNSTLNEALKTSGTAFARQGNGLGNYSIPGWIPNEQIGINISDYYWTRSAMSNWYGSVRRIDDKGKFHSYGTYWSHGGVRPCLLLQY